MRKLAALWLTLCLLSGCGVRGDAPEYYSLWFLCADLSDAAGEGALRPVASGVALGGDDDPGDTARALLSALLRGPENDAFRNALPAGTLLNSVTLEGSRATVDFSSAYGSLSGIALTLADYAVTLTLTQIPEISTVRVTVAGRTLDYRDRQSFTARDVLLLPDGDVVGTVTLALWFPDASGELVPEERTLNLYEGDTQVEVVARAVEDGPDNRELYPAFPEGFRVRSVWQERDICFVNLSSAVLETLPEDADLSGALLSLDRSLRGLESVREVRYLADGEFLDEYGGVRLMEPYDRVA